MLGFLLTAAIAFQDALPIAVMAQPLSISEKETTAGESLLHGSVCQALPGEWAGRWQGQVQLQEEKLAGNASQNQLSAAAVDFNLQLEAAKTGSQVFHLGVEQLSSGTDSTENRQDASRQQGPEPDIIFWHDHSHGHALFRNGASVVIQGNGARAVQGNGGSADQNGISYNNGGIVFNGATTFHGHYFKADEQLTSNKNTAIQTDRLDIDGATMYPAGTPIQVKGNHESGYLINCLRGSNLQPAKGAGSENQSVSPLELIGNKTKILEMETTVISAGVFDQNSLAALLDKTGITCGYQRNQIRYTALSPQRMLVQATITNYRTDWTLQQVFTVSGYLRKELNAEGLPVDQPSLSD